MEVIDADRDQMERVLRSSHAIWGEGLGLEDYLDYNRAQKDSPWGRERYRFLVGIDRHGTILSSLKLYTLPGRLEGRAISIAGIGAVFTPPDLRGRGHAAEILRQALQPPEGTRHGLALLMSEIGTAWYEQLGFRALPASEAACMTMLPAPWPREPAWTREGDPFRHVAGLRPFTRDDLDQVAALRDAADREQRFRVVRDRPAWEQVLLKLEMGRTLRGEGDNLLWVIERHGRVEAYAVLRERRAGLVWLEHAALPGAGDRLIDLFWSALVVARRRGLGRIDGWFLPPSIASGGIYPVARRPRGSPAVMIRPLDPAGAPAACTREEECRIGQLDSF